MGRRIVTEHLICRNCLSFRGCGNPTITIDVCVEHGFLTPANAHFCTWFQCGDWSNIKRKERVLFDDGLSYQTTHQTRRA